MDLQRRSAELQNQKMQLRAQHQALTMDHTAAETTLRYLQEQKDDANVYYSLGRMYVLFRIRVF